MELYVINFFFSRCLKRQGVYDPKQFTDKGSITPCKKSRDQDPLSVRR